MRLVPRIIPTVTFFQNYQQPLDLTIRPEEEVFFVVTGSHAVHLTGNYTVDASGYEGLDTESDEDGLDDLDDGESESDELDGIENPRIMEVESDEEKAPKLVEAKKGKNKRPAEDETEGLDDMMAKAGPGAATKLSKKQQKKLKNNDGKAVTVEKEVKAFEKDASKGDKKVQFAKQLEQGPTGSAATVEKTTTEKTAEKTAEQSVKVVQGVTVDDRKIGSGRVVKKGNKVGLRYIGKLKDTNKIFDCKCGLTRLVLGRFD